jgi:hypothetical protein
VPAAAQDRLEALKWDQGDEEATLVKAVAVGAR